MTQPNGHKPQHHLSVKEIVAAHREKMMTPWHSDLLDLDFLIRPRTGAEIAALSDESQRILADVEKYKGSADEPGAIEQLRLGLRSAIPVLLDPQTREPRFGMDEVDDLLEFEMPVINELMEAVNRISTFTQADAVQNGKNSVEEGENNSSSTLPSDQVAHT